MSCSLRNKKYLQGEEGKQYMNMQILSQRGTCSDEERSLVFIKQRSMPNVGHSLTTTFLPLKPNCSVEQ